MSMHCRSSLAGPDPHGRVWPRETILPKAVNRSRSVALVPARSAEKKTVVFQ